MCLQSSRPIRSLRKQRGATLIEVIVVCVLVGVALVFLAPPLVRFFSRKTTVVFTTAPATISLQAGGTGSFVYSFSQTGFRAGSRANRRTGFSVTPASGIVIESVTDGVGNVLAVGATSGSGTTDASGNVTVVVKMTVAGPATLTGTDVGTGVVEVVRFDGVK